MKANLSDPASIVQQTSGIQQTSLAEQKTNQDKAPSLKVPWGKLIVVVVIISLAVGTLSGIFLSGMATELLGKTKIVGEIPGVTTKIKNAEEDSEVISAVEKVKPAVVNIVVTKDLSKIYKSNPFNNFLPFFDIVPPDEDDGETKVGGGTGFIISSDGMILTNRHVVSDEEANYTVIMSDATEYEAKVLARDPSNDIAMLKVDAKDLPVTELGDSSSLKVGQTVIAIGNALGQYQNSVTKGIVSATERDITAGTGQSTERLSNIIQVDAAINQGNSGSPLVNLEGQVVGINTAVDLGGQLIGFAIPINDAKDAIQSVKEKGKIVRPYLGVRYIILNKQIAKENDLKFDYGALVIKGSTVADIAVVPGSPADKAGIVENDIILEFDGKKITEDNDLSSMISKKKSGDAVKLKVYHQGNEKEVDVKLEEK